MDKDIVKIKDIANIIPSIIVLLYLVSPIELVPDCIPVIGYLDDIIISILLYSLNIIICIITSKL